MDGGEDNLGGSQFPPAFIMTYAKVAPAAAPRRVPVSAFEGPVESCCPFADEGDMAVTVVVVTLMVVR